MPTHHLERRGGFYLAGIAIGGAALALFDLWTWLLL
jgi:hypothetical protein